MRPKLTLTFDAGWGERFSMCLPIEEHQAKEFCDITPPTPAELGGSFEMAVQTMKRREFRKDAFVLASEKLGRLLAERMEDAEGWHDASRIEPAKQALRSE